MKWFGIPSKVDPERIPHGSRPRRIRIAAGAAVLAVAAGGAALIPSAQAEDAVTNHIYIHDHGSPSCTITFYLYDNMHYEVSKDSKTMVGNCGGSLEWDPSKFARANVDIDSGTVNKTYEYNSSTSSGHDHCILVKAFGQIVETGDETQGCTAG